MLLTWNEVTDKKYGKSAFRRQEDSDEADFCRGQLVINALARLLPTVILFMN